MIAHYQAEEMVEKSSTTRESSYTSKNVLHSVEEINQKNCDVSNGN